MLEVIDACLNTKFLGRWSKMACQIALNAIDIVYADTNGRVEIDIKRYIRIEKIPGDNIENSYVLPGIMIGKDIIHPQMRRYIENPKILLLDCPLEYKKLESQTNVEMLDNQGLSDLLQLEEMYIGKICSDIIAMKPDVVFCEKGISDLALHYLVKANISALRRVRKSDNNRLARACGATIVHRTDELQPFDIGTKAGLFEIKKIGDEYFTYVTKCEDPKACTIILRGPSKDVLNEAERNLQDALNVARNLMLDPRILPGGGAVEMEAAKCLQKIAPNFPKESPIFRAVAKGLEIIPLTLASNCGSKPVRVLTKLRATHARGLTTIGIDGITGKLTDMTNKNIWEPLRVKSQIYKSAIESCNLLLRIDEILSGVSSKAGTPEKPPVDSKKE